MLTVVKTLPDYRLQPFIRFYVQREVHLRPGLELIEPVVARLGTMLEFDFAGSYEVLSYGSDEDNASTSIDVIGPINYRRVRLIMRGDIQSLVVMFQPLGFHAIFGVPTAPFSDRGTEAHAVLGPAITGLRERMGNAARFAERARILDNFFLRRVQDAAQPDRVCGALQRLAAGRPGVRVGDVARQTGLSVRQLERKCLEYAGVSPKTLTRLGRFNRALRLRETSSMTWTAIAQAAAYHDQMHMIRDFREFAGEAPKLALEEMAPEHLIHFAQ